MSSLGGLLALGAGRIGRSGARTLLCRAAACTPEVIAAHPEKTVTAGEESLFLELLDEASGGRPLPYITGIQPFWKHEFTVSEAVLIPRPDTETLVEEALAAAKNFSSPRILDLGTGSGCVALSLAMEMPGSRVTAIDDSPAALSIAATNMKRLGAANVELLVSDWYKGLPKGGIFDIIVSNPPYVQENDPHLSALAAEPAEALTGGVSGLDDLQAVISPARCWLAVNGVLLVEHGYSQGKDVRRLFRSAGLADIRTVRDPGGNERVTSGRREADPPPSS